MNVEELIELTCEVQAGGGGASDARAEEGEEKMSERSKGKGRSPP